MVQLSAEPYGKALMLRGDTKPVAESLKGLGGKWNGKIQGWLFPGSKASTVCATLREAGHTVDGSMSSGGGDGAAPASDGAGGSEAPAAKATSSKKRAPATPQEGKDTGRGGTKADACTDKDFSIPLGENKKRRLSISLFSGSPCVDIREWYGDEDDLKPGKKGIQLKLEEWETIKKSLAEIDAAIQKVS
mmetsp:Transcript_24339/g.44668  ORF Transcript_24339/g.44668 Transcript_24339/m.44668 type:complete len:190 (-) Transcript_24339:160-729(-)